MANSSSLFVGTPGLGSQPFKTPLLTDKGNQAINDIGTAFNNFNQNVIQPGSAITGILGDAAHIANNAIVSGGAELASGVKTHSDSFFTAIFLRSIVIITGFIFLAAGLSMFKSPAILQETQQNFRRSARRLASLKGKKDA